MALLDNDNFDNFPTLRASSRNATAAMLRAMRFMDSCKECVLILEGMPLTAAQIHKQAHVYGEMWDQFGDILHQRHFLQEFPATPELDEAPDLTRALEIVLWCMDEIDKALVAFIRACDEAGMYPLARAAEGIQMENSIYRTLWLQAAKMWDLNKDKLSYEKWIEELFDQEDD